MKDPVVIIGVGEIGSVLARGFLRTGHPVYPITRSMTMTDELSHIPEPALIVVAVGEADLHATLEQIPAQWRQRIALIQNELLPHDWQRHDLEQPTVISVWFEKKKGQDVKVVVPSPVYGEKAGLLAAALDSLQIPAYLMDNVSQLMFELVRKNYYILVSNISGLVTGGTVSELWNDHRDVAQAVAQDVHRIQEHLTGQALPHEELIAAMVKAFEGDPDHMCMGRSAPARLQRALQIAAAVNIAVPALQDIAAKQQ